MTPNSEQVKVTLSNKELVEKVLEWNDKLCRSGGRDWTLRVPADMNRDPDFLISELCKRFTEALSQQPTATKGDGLDVMGDYILRHIGDKAFPTVNGAYYHYSDVCALLRKTISEVRDSDSRHPTTPTVTAEELITSEELWKMFSVPEEEGFRMNRDGFELALGRYESSLQSENEQLRKELEGERALIASLNVDKEYLTAEVDRLKRECLTEGEVLLFSAELPLLGYNVEQIEAELKKWKASRGKA